MAAYGHSVGRRADDFARHFFTWGVLVGVVGIPIWFDIRCATSGPCNRAGQSPCNFSGGFIGMVAYEISAACRALIGASGKAAPGQQTDYLLIGFALAYVVLAIASVLYARSSPRHRIRGEGGDAD